MKQIVFITGLLISLVFLSSCDDDRYFVKGSGPSVNNVRFPGTYSGVALCVSANVEIYRDSAFRVELYGQQNVLNVIDTRTSGNTLRIELQRSTVLKKHEPVTIKVYMPYLSQMDLSGSGDMSCIDDFSATDLSTNVSGSGNILYRGSVFNRFNATVSGSGSIRNSGSSNCNYARYNISGSGNIYAEWLKVQDVEARISGSGDEFIHALGTLEAHISGSGDIHYRGTPAVSVHISGSGRLIPIK
ncbi:MAG: DUF2807 domain-containing protein [Bacteroidetes bacterium]|nr:DUF2807 domain-containing protein [Bacteroidota bacterium]